MHYISSTFTVLTVLLASAVNATPIAGLKAPSCKLDKVQLPVPPVGYGSSWTGPENGLSLARIVIGVGTQNYTCASNKATDKPSAIGAYATLYDTSCVAATNINLLHSLPAILMQGVFGDQKRLLNGVLSTIAYAGIHEFRPNPTFDFVPSNGGAGFFAKGQSAQRQLFVGKKKENVACPPEANAGEFGTVDWLNLDSTPESIGLKRAYRVITAGGKAPPNCEGRPATFEIAYATEYWFYK